MYMHNEITNWLALWHNWLGILLTHTQGLITVTAVMGRVVMLVCISVSTCVSIISMCEFVKIQLYVCLFTTCMSVCIFMCAVETQRQSTPLSKADYSATLRTPGVHHSHGRIFILMERVYMWSDTYAAVGVCPRIVGFFTSVMFKFGSLLYLAATTILCLDVVLLHRYLYFFVYQWIKNHIFFFRLFHSGVSTVSWLYVQDLGD